MRVNLPSTLIAADGTALCLDLKNLGSEYEIHGLKTEWSSNG